MQLLRKVINNVVISLLGQAITWISTVLLTAAYGRFLGDTRFGELYFAITFVALIGFPLEFGFNQQLIRDVAQKPEEALRYLTNTLILKLLLWLPFFGLLVGLSWLLGYSPDERLLVEICGITMLSTAITNVFSGLHSAFSRTYFSALGTILERVTDAAVGICLLRIGAGVEVMALVLLAGSLVNTLWQGIWCFCKVGFFRRPDYKFMLFLFKSSIPFLIYGVLGVIYYRIDTVMLSLMTNDTAVGWYGAAYRLFDTLLFLPSLIISAIIYPIFSKLTLHAEPQLKLAIEKTMNFVLFCGVPIATFMAITAPQIIGYLYHNPDFTHSVTTLQALAPGLVFLYANSVLTSVLLSTHRERKIIVLALCALAFNVTTNLILIPLLAQLGTALTTSATELVLLIVSLILIPNNLLPVKSLLSALRILVATAAMGACLWWLQISSLLLLLPLGLIVYLCVALLCQAIPLSDIRTLYISLRNKRTRPRVALGELDENQIAFLAKVDTNPLPTLDIQTESDTTSPAETMITPIPGPISLPEVALAQCTAINNLEQDEPLDPEATWPRSPALKLRKEIERVSTIALPLTPIPDQMIEDHESTEPRIHIAITPQPEQNHFA